MPTQTTKSAPLKGKMVFLDTKAPVSKLREQLELLGARVETFFSKDIWCVITDKQIHEVDKKLLSTAANAARVLLKAAQQKETKNKDDELQTVVQECKQWDIPMLSIKTASTSVSKLMRKYQPVRVVPSSKKYSAANPLRKAASESHLGKTTRLEGDEILKVEDKKQLYKPVYKAFKEQDYPRVKVLSPKSSLTGLIGPFAEEIHDSSQKAMFDESRRNQADTGRVIKAADLKTGSGKRKLGSRHADTKSKYCEICHEYFVNLRSHLSSSSHIRASNACLGDLEKIVEEFHNGFFEGLKGTTRHTSPKRRRISNADRDISSVEV